MAIQLDMRTGLPKARAALPDVLNAQMLLRCDYTAPCVVGAMLTPQERITLEYKMFNEDGYDIGSFIRAGDVQIPKGQKADFVALQEAFDGGDQGKLVRKLEALEVKYAATVSA